MQANNTGDAVAVESKFTEAEIDAIMLNRDQVSSLFGGQTFEIMLITLALYVVDQAFTGQPTISDSLNVLSKLQKRLESDMVDYARSKVLEAHVFMSADQMRTELARAIELAPRG